MLSEKDKSCLLRCERGTGVIQHPNRAHDTTVAERRLADGLGRDGKNLGDADSLTLNSHFDFHAACRVNFRHLLSSNRSAFWVSNCRLDFNHLTCP